MTAPEQLWSGGQVRECGDHRTVGQRAWCFDDRSWCYPDDMCRGCELPVLRARIAHLESRPP